MRRQKGQALIEILVALAAVIAVIIAVTVVVSAALNNASFSKNQNLATQYAQQGMDIVRQIRDNSWTDFKSYHNAIGTSYFLAQNSTVLVGPAPSCPPTNCTPPNVGIFLRQVNIQKNSPDCTPGAKISKVSVLVNWSDKACSPSTLPCHEVKVVSCFANLYTVGAP